jgi:phosphate uptake regulator
MKRKVIQIANSTQLVSLPRKWTQKYGIKKGDELEVLENGNKVIINVDKGIELKSKEIDITGLDRASIVYYLQGLYRLGYDEIKVIFNNPVTNYFRQDKEVKVIKVIYKEVNKSLGFEVIQHKENYCLIKDISTSSIKEFDNILRRIFLLLKDASSDLTKGAKDYDKNMLENLEEKHDSIKRFINYSCRLLNKYGYPKEDKTVLLFHNLGDLDKVIDIINNTARDLVNFNHKLGPKSIEFFHYVDTNLNIFFEFFYKFDSKKSVELFSNRSTLSNFLYKNKNKIPPDELILLCKLESIMEIITDMQIANLNTTI